MNCKTAIESLNDLHIKSELHGVLDDIIDRVDTTTGDSFVAAAIEKEQAERLAEDSAILHQVGLVFYPSFKII